MMDAKIAKVIQEIPNVTTLFFDADLGAKPGQFGMFWLPGEGQRPMSFSYSNAITVKNIGPFSAKLSALRPGDMISIEGPYGNSFDISGSSAVLIGGGFGIAPLRFVAQECYKKNIAITSLLGFKSLEDVFFEKELSKYGDVHIATEDGSCGEKGMITCLFNTVKHEFDKGYCCGPERMMAAAMEHFGKHMPLQLSLERYMKCGMGLCGSCEVDGLLVCKDGPVFYQEQLGPSFGKFKRDKTGRKIPI
ncbi:MAG: dihydroorotate dehydrogenase electron transfer subunit [Candidatus Methanofastidiosia archaeon]